MRKGNNLLAAGKHENTFLGTSSVDAAQASRLEFFFKSFFCSNIEAHAKSSTTAGTLENPHVFVRSI